MQKNDYNYLKPFFPDMEQEKVFWSFICFSRQDYASKVPLGCEDEIMLALQCADGGCVTEMAIRWHNLGKTVSPRLECFGEAWPMLLAPSCAKVMQMLAARHDQDLSPDDVTQILLESGFKDLSDHPWKGDGKGGEGCD